MHLGRKMRKVYDACAAEYADRTSKLEFFSGLEGELIGFCVRLDAKGTILDLGCGGGRDSEYFVHQGWNVVACDISGELLGITRARSALVSVVQADMMRLPFRENCFVGAWVCASMVHIALGQHMTALKELFRVLISGGTVAISMKAGTGEGWKTGGLMDGPRWFSHVEPSSFVDVMESAGFSDVSTSWSGRGAWFIAVGVKA